jgi:broad specificity phosphatase PhoE
MELTFLRHAESIFNRDGTSEKNCSLSELGVQQASQVTGSYDVIICSILKRAKETLLHSQLSSKHLYFTDTCREVRRDICDYLDHEDESIPDTDEEIEKKIKNFKEFLRSKVKATDKVLVISHRDFIHAIGKGKYPLPKNAEFQILTV